MSSTLDSDADELRRRAEVEKAKTAGSGRRANQSGLGILKKFSKYKEVTAKYRTPASGDLAHSGKSDSSVVSPSNGSVDRGTSVEQTSDEHRTNVGQTSDKTPAIKNRSSIPNLPKTSDKRRTNVGQESSKLAGSPNLKTSQLPSVNVGQTSDEHLPNVGQVLENKTPDSTETSDERRTNVGQVKIDKSGEIEYTANKADFSYLNVGQTSDKHLPNVGQNEQNNLEAIPLETSDERRTNIGQQIIENSEEKQDTYKNNIGQTSDKHLPNVGQSEQSTLESTPPETSDKRRTNIGQKLDLTCDSVDFNPNDVPPNEPELNFKLAGQNPSPPSIDAILEDLENKKVITSRTGDYHECNLESPTKTKEINLESIYSQTHLFENEDSTQLTNHSDLNAESQEKSSESNLESDSDELAFNKATAKVLIAKFNEIAKLAIENDFIENKNQERRTNVGQDSFQESKSPKINEPPALDNTSVIQEVSPKETSELQNKSTKLKQSRTIADISTEAYSHSNSEILSSRNQQDPHIDTSSTTQEIIAQAYARAKAKTAAKPSTERSNRFSEPEHLKKLNFQLTSENESGNSQHQTKVPHSNSILPKFENSLPEDSKSKTSDKHRTNISLTSDEHRTTTSDKHLANVSLTSDERRTQHRTNVGQEQDESARLERLGTQEFAFMRFTYQLCESMGSLETPRIALRDIAEACSINGNTAEAIRKNAYKVISRVMEKNLVSKIESKDGRNGWVRFGLTRSVYHALFNINKMVGTLTPDLSKHRTERRTNVGLEGGGVNYINNTPTPVDQSDDEKLMSKAHSFDIERLAQFGFTYNHLVKILRSGKFKDEELLQESLDHIAYHLMTKGTKGLNTPHVFIEKTLIRDGFYRVPGFMGFQAQAQEHYIEYMAEKRAREEEQAGRVLAMMSEGELASLDQEAEERLGPPKSEIERKSRKMMVEIERKKIVLEKIKRGIDFN